MNTIKRFAFLILIITSFSVHAQNWKVIPANGSMFTHDNTDYYYPVWIDSVGVSGTDSIFYFARTIGYVDSIPQGYYHPAAPSWTGYYAIKNIDSVMFFNHKILPLLIKPNEPIGSTWIFCDADSNLIFHAKVDSIIEETILGNIDSVKYISIQATDTLGNPVNHVMNHTLKIGKTTGLMQAYPFFGFMPVSAMTNYFGYEFFNVPDGILSISGNGKTGVTDIDYLDAFNYQENSKVYIYSSGYAHTPGYPIYENSQHFLLQEFNYKSTFGNIDSIQFEYHQCKKLIDYVDSSNNYISEGDYSVTYKELNSTNYILMSKRCGTKVKLDTNNLQIGIPVLLKHTSGRIGKVLPYMCGIFYYEKFNDSLYAPPLCDCEVYQPYYYKNLGGPYIKTAYMQYYMHERTLIGFSDSTQTWGTLKTCGEILSVEENNELSFRLFPNPVKDVLNIEFETSQTGIVRIFDARGTLIYNLDIENQDRIEINSAEFPTGIYILQFNGNSNGSVVFVKE